MTKIITAGRTDLKDFFEKSGNFTGTKLTHTPFLVFREEEGAIRVYIVDSADQLLSFSDETPVMGQWQGNYRSDFFQFTVGDYRPYADEKRKQWEKALLSARNVVKQVGPQGGFRHMSYEYTAEAGHTVHTSATSATEAGELEAFFNQHSIPITVKREEKQKRDSVPWTMKPPYLK
jgi:hypothetical protein